MDELEERVNLALEYVKGQLEYDQREADAHQAKVDADENVEYNRMFQMAHYFRIPVLEVLQSMLEEPKK